MASIATDPNGRRRILFVASDGKRRTVRLGPASQKDAEHVRRRVEALVSASILGNAPDDETSRWLVSLSDPAYARLAAVGLVKARQSTSVSVGVFVDAYLAERKDLKPGTLIVMRQARRWLASFLGEDKPLQTVTAADADAYRAWLLGEKRAKATVVKWCRYARHYFEVARRRKLITENPFAHIGGSIRGNAARRVFVPASDVLKVMEAAPDPQWRLLIALARWGGLRIPSEALALTWRDVDFAGRRFIVRASKTEHHADGGIRVVPMFPELVEHFQTVFDAAPAGSIHVITRYRGVGKNLRTQLVRYITAAGLKPWPKPWQNLRASRATELADEFPSHVYASWLGHTEAIADEFYRQVTDTHFIRALGSAAQFPAQYGSESARTASQYAAPQLPQLPDLQRDADICDSVRNVLLGAEGFEPPTKGL